MRIFLVGGAVRDILLGHRPKDRDYVVVGATVEEFLGVYPKAKQIGKAFPVFQDFVYGEKAEFAFARKERKVGAGHGGFEVVADPSVTLEDDLARRDLTINAMAREVYPYQEARLGDLIDPFGGRADLDARILRHVGPAFVEDPLRVYRLARFAARFGFTVAPETLQICRDVPKSELGALSGERVGEELRRALRSPFPWLFFDVLRDVGALAPWMPEIGALVGVPAGPPAHHQEGDTFDHTMMALQITLYGGTPGEPFVIAGMSEAQVELVRFGALVHDLGKALTPPEEWPAHHGHDERGVAPTEELCDRLHLPTWFKQFGVLACREHMRVHNFLDMRKGKMADLVRSADATRPKTEGLVAVCMADACGKEPRGETKGAEALAVAAPAARAEKGQPLPLGLEGPQIGAHVRNCKGTAIRRALRTAGFIQGGPERPQHERVLWNLQETETFPDGPPQREAYTDGHLGDLEHLEAAQAYAREWRKVFRCVGCGMNVDCPQHGALGFHKEA